MSQERIPTGRFGEINELSNLAMYLVSDYANWMTGEVKKLALFLVSSWSYCSETRAKLFKTLCFYNDKTENRINSQKTIDTTTTTTTTILL